MSKVTQLLLVCLIVSSRYTPRPGIFLVPNGYDASRRQPLWQGHRQWPHIPPSPTWHSLPPPPLLTGGQGGQGAGTSFFSGLLFLSAVAHSPFCTALNSMGFRSPYSPEATSMTGDTQGVLSQDLSLVPKGEPAPPWVCGEGRSQGDRCSQEVRVHDPSPQSGPTSRPQPLPTGLHSLKSAGLW